jgi:hypothetical protein
MKKYNIKNSKRVTQIVQAMTCKDSIKCDPQGSYTGKPENPYEDPVQDQDDL